MLIILLLLSAEAAADGFAEAAVGDGQFGDPAALLSRIDPYCSDGSLLNTKGPARAEDERDETEVDDDDDDDDDDNDDDDNGDTCSGC